MTAPRVAPMRPPGRWHRPAKPNLNGLYHTPPIRRPRAGAGPMPGRLRIGDRTRTPCASLIEDIRYKRYLSWARRALWTLPRALAENPVQTTQSAVKSTHKNEAITTGPGSGLKGLKRPIRRRDMAKSDSLWLSQNSQLWRVAKRNIQYNFTISGRTSIS
jgi:hypothetical protein